MNKSAKNLSFTQASCGNLTTIHKLKTLDLGLKTYRDNKNYFSKNSPVKSSGGFTLIEILVALTIIAIAMGALIKSTGNHTATARYLKQKTIAHYVAMNEIQKLRIENKFPSIGIEKKSTEMAKHIWYWEQEVKAVLLDAPGIEKPKNVMREVSITVYSDENYEKNLTKLYGFIIKL